MAQMFKTKYQQKENSLYRDGVLTGISLVDDQFFLNGKSLNLYKEDGKIFVLAPLFPFFRLLKISRSSGNSIDENGDVWSQSEKCVFDAYFER